MKKLVSVVLVFILVCGFSFAEIDLSGMSFEELVELQKSVSMAIMESDGWQEVVVPQGTYTAGEDIPAGKWKVSLKNELMSQVCVNEYEQAVILSSSDKVGTIYLENGDSIEIIYGGVTFSPYTGELGFK